MHPGPTLRLAALFASLALSVGLAAQRPGNVRGSNPPGKVALGQKMDCENMAGAIDGFTDFTGQSSTFGDVDFDDIVDFNNRPDTIFLCANDGFRVLHGGGEVLTGDPVTTTPAGVGFAFYECPPTIGGETLDDVLTDPCIPTDGLEPFDSLAVTVGLNWLSGNYDITVTNDGFPENNSFPDFFPDAMGNTGPVVLTLAPITFDAVNPDGLVAYEQEDDDGPVGPCVNVNLDQAFTVAFLKPLLLGNINVNNPTCEGSFRIEGGAPELRGNAGYTITIENVNTGELATITTPADQIVHGSTFNYEVPTAGDYRVTVMDDLSCLLEALTVTHAEGCIFPVTIILPTAQGVAGTTQCFPVTISEFTDVVGLSFEFSFDPTVVQFTGFQNPNPALTGTSEVNGPMSSGGTLPDGIVRYLYDGAFSDPTTLDDGDVLLELCFEFIGDEGERTDLTFETTDNPPNYTREVNGGNESGNADGVDGFLNVLNANLDVTVTRTNETCNGDDDGTITATATTSETPLTFSIRRTSPNPEAMFRDERTVATSPGEATYTGLENGDYEIRVVNGDGEELIRPVTIDAGINFTVNVDVDEENQPSCNGFDDGFVVAEVSVDGVRIQNPEAAGFRFQWEGRDDTTSILTGLRAGRYEVTVTAPNGICTTDDSGNLNQPQAVTVRPDNPADAVSSATCDGAPDGSITITADGGSGPYEFAWPDGLGTDNGVDSERMSLLPGEYAVTVTDTRGCADTANFVVDALKSLIIVSSVDSITCFGESDGIIRVNGSVTGAAATGNFFVTLLDTLGNVLQPEADITDNTTPFEFTGLAPDTYVVNLRDEDPVGCSIMQRFAVGGPEELEFSEDLEIRNETCSVGMDGQAEATVTGGTLPYTYSWRNDSLETALDTVTLGPLLDSLSADSNYVLTVTDARGCTIVDSFRISAPAGAQIGPIEPAFVSCPGDTDGQLTATVSPPPGETIVSTTWYMLNPDSTLGAQIATGNSTPATLGVGFYALEVITSNDCPAFAIGVVTSPGLVFLETFEALSPECPGEQNGTISVTPGGGTPNADGSYNYVWSTDPGTVTTSPVLSGLTAGTYSVTITDANNCQPPFDTTFVLADPPAITGQFLIENVSCPDDDVADGAASFTAVYSDGSPGNFDFQWSSGTLESGTTTSTDFGLARGVVSVTVDDGVCSVTFTDTIGSPDEFVIDVDIDEVSCNGLADGTATVNVTGGTGAYTFAWTGLADTDNTIENIAAGDYEVLITDENGCSPGPFVFTVRQPDALALSIDEAVTTESVTCAGDVDGVIGVLVTSLNNNDLGDAPYQWSGGVAGPSDAQARDLAPGTYSVTVTDVEGCQDSLSFTIDEPEAITFTVLPIEEPLCFGQPTPVFIDTAFGGTSTGFEDFTFTINNDGFRVRADTPGETFAGDVTVTVFDAAGCSSEQQFSVNQPPEILIDLPGELVIELGDSLTRLNPIVSPVGDLYQYVWTPPVFLSNDSIRDPVIFPFQDVNYTLEVTNQNGCQAFADIFVEVDANRNVYIPNVFSPNRDGRNEDFRVFTCRGVRRVTNVQIFDRWGGLVFQADNLPPNCLDGIQLWDGSAQSGKPMNGGVFVYVVEVEFLDNATLTYRGDVTLVR